MAPFNDVAVGRMLLLLRMAGFYLILNFVLYLCSNYVTGGYCVAVTVFYVVKCSESCFVSL